MIRKSLKTQILLKKRDLMRGKNFRNKLHIAVDILGLPHAMLVTTAEVTDRNGAISMIGFAAPNLSKCIKVLVDSGYTGENFSNSIKRLIGAPVEVVERNELHKFAVLPKRWIVERTFGWL